MVERYFLADMKNLWSLENQYKRWLEVEIAVLRAYEELGKIPKGVSDEVKNNAKIDVERILEVERVVDHEVIAFIKAVTENLNETAKRYFHHGLTSSDIIDTALSLALKRCCNILKKDLEKLLKALWNLAKKYKYTPIIGRTHGVHAEPTSFGLKVLSWYAEFLRDKERLERACDEISVGKISGAVGNYANVSPEIEKLALSYLGLKPTPVSTQIINRDYHANFISTLALIGGAVERMAIEIRNLQRTEILEVEEPFKVNQRGSSAMPHKKNPVLCERLTGLARILRSFTLASLENMALWHERDISHSSVERYIFPDVTSTLHYMLVKSSYLIEGLKVNEKMMMENIDKTKGLIFSQRALLKLVEKGYTRENAYKEIQKRAIECWKRKEPFKEKLKDLFTEKELEELFEISYYLKHVDDIFARFK